MFEARRRSRHARCGWCLLSVALWLGPGFARAADSTEPDRADEDLPADALSLDGLRGLLVVVEDRTGRFADAAPVVSVVDGGKHAEQVLADDGEAPDGLAGDGVYAGLLSDPPTGESVRLVLSDATGAQLWADELPITPGMALPRVDFTTEGDHVRARVATVIVGVTGAPAPGGAVVSSGGAPPPPPPGTTGAALSGGVTSGAGLIVAGMLGLMGLLAGVVVGVVIGRRGQPRVALEGVGKAPPPPALDGLPAIRGARQVWRVPSAEVLPAVTVALVRHLAPAGPVLLAVGAKRRPAIADSLGGLPNVVMLADLQPPPDALLDAAELLAGVGRPVIVVEGAAGLEAPERGEHADAVIVELLEHAGEEVDVLVLLAPGNWPGVEPTATVALDEDGAPVAG